VWSHTPRPEHFTITAQGIGEAKRASIFMPVCFWHIPCYHLQQLQYLPMNTAMTFSLIVVREAGYSGAHGQQSAAPVW
jgi:hypothetical protein